MKIRNYLEFNMNNVVSYRVRVQRPNEALMSIVFSWWQKREMNNEFHLEKIM